MCKSSLNSSFKSIIAVAWWVWCNVWNIESDNQVHSRCLSMPIMTERADDWTSCCFNDVSVWALEALTTSWFMRTIVEFQDITFLDKNLSDEKWNYLIKSKIFSDLLLCVATKRWDEKRPSHFCVIHLMGMQRKYKSWNFDKFNH